MMAKSKTAAPFTVSKTLALQDLRAGDAINARRTGRDTSLDELKASILAHGVVQSLRVRLVGQSHYEVVAGNRRLLALDSLCKEGKIEPDYQVPVIVGMLDDAAAHELSVVENVERVPVSPIDEFKAYGRLQQEGSGAEEIAARFGVPLRRVQQRMKLANLHPKVLGALEQGQIGIDTAQAFTVAEPERQVAVFDELSKRGIYAYEVKQKLTDTFVPADGGLAKLIGEEAYLAAGGAIISDLFAERAYWSSTDIVRKLVEASWAERVNDWLADGWAWVKSESDVPDWYNRVRVYPRQVEMPDADAARLAELEAEMESFDTDNGLDDDEQEAWNVLDREAVAIQSRYGDVYSQEDKAKSGVVYWPANGRIELGIGEPRAGTGASGSGAPAEKKALDPQDPAAVGPTVSETLSAVLSDSIRTEVAADPDLALPLLAAFMAVGQGGGTVPAHLSVGSAHGKGGGKQGIAEAFRFFDAMPDEELLAAIARMFANTLDVGDSFLTSTKYVSPTTRPKLVAELVDIVEPRTFPEFDAAAYFGAVKKPLIAAAFKEITGDAIKDGKKADMAETTTKLAVEHGWLPIVLRNVTYEGPGTDVAPVQEAAE